MAKPYSAGMSDEIELDGGYTLRVTAVDPTTGNLVSGITVSNLVIHARPLGETTPTDLAGGPWQLVPGPGA